MSAGICGKRLGLEEIFGSPAQSSPSAKKIRHCSSGYGSPIRPADFGFGSDDRVSALLRMFPSMEREVVEKVLKIHDHKIDDAIKSLHALCLSDVSARNESAVLNSLIQSNGDCEGGMSSQTPPEQKVEDICSDGPETESRLPQNGSPWVDIFVQEMMNASNWDDVRSRAMKILEAFEKSVLDHSAALKEQENGSLKEQLQCLFKENQILKKAVTIQHERNLEQEEKLKEVEQLKHIISQYQEQVRTLETSGASQDRIEVYYFYERTITRSRQTAQLLVEGSPTESTGIQLDSGSVPPRYILKPRPRFV
ncbi:uncharacterized protein M6B38_208280 [Iris pallida]|uniref:CUE domain-containing protein n=1 Tax=Iris pallida TaxID=29817 RepID=A0AAX6E566_IRIPA|nr:uncharacterized protein M6B38_208280 [Iris pallida]